MKTAPTLPRMLVPLLARLVASLVVTATLQGCAVGPDYVRPNVDTPPVWTAGGLGSPRPGNELPPDQNWWLSFGDEQLAALVQRAVQDTPGQRQAAARVRQARAQRAVTAGRLWPKLDTASSYSNSRISQNGFLQGLGSGGEDNGGAPPGAVFPGQAIDLYQTGFDAQWELDFFGHVRRGVEAATAEVGAAEAAYQNSLLTLAAETAREVIEIRTLDARLAIAASNIHAQADTLDVIRQRSQAGVSSDLDVARAEAHLASTESDVPLFRSRRNAALQRLAVLVATDAPELNRELSTTTQGIPTPPRFIDAGLPSQLLLRRPDVAVSERELAAATASIGEARAELFPRFSLSGSFGFQSQNTGNLLTSDSRFWLIGPGMRWPIFDAGRLLANVAVKNARCDEAAAAYDNTVRNAFADVETALGALAENETRVKALQREADAEGRGAALARELFAGGVVEFLDVLDAERSLYRSQDELAISRGATAQEAVALYKALAGGWPLPQSPTLGPSATERAGPDGRSVATAK